MTLVQDILALASKGPAGLEEADRLALLQASEKLTQALETPMDKFLRHFFVRIFDIDIHSTSGMHSHYTVTRY